MRYKTRKAFSMAGYVLVLLAAVINFSDQMTNLTVIIGALSAGVGFALRELIQSLSAGAHRIASGCFAFATIANTSKHSSAEIEAKLQ